MTVHVKNTLREDGRVFCTIEIGSHLVPGADVPQDPAARVVVECFPNREIDPQEIEIATSMVKLALSSNRGAELFRIQANATDLKDTRCLHGHPITEHEAETKFCPMCASGLR